MLKKIKNSNFAVMKSLQLRSSPAFVPYKREFYELRADLMYKGISGWIKCKGKLQ